MDLSRRQCRALCHVTVLISLWSLIFGADISYHIFEERNVGTIVGDIPIDVNINQYSGEVDISTLRFTFSNTGYNSYFTVDDSTGVLRTDYVLDRENLCEYEVTCLLPLKVAVKSTLGSFFIVFDIDVFLDDINDHAPEFSIDFFPLEISEKVLIGTSFKIEGARDRDTSPTYSLRSYELQSNDLPVNEELPFTINFVKNLDGSSLVQLSVTAHLDHETRNIYEMEIVAKDGDTPPKVGVLPVRVVIDDENDNSPVFSAQSYNRTISEGANVGDFIIQVFATDLDTGNNGQVQYRFSQHQATEIFDHFEINGVTGGITLKKKISYSPGKEYKIIVEAFDTPTTGQSLTAQTLVVVMVENSSNDPPKITINTLTETDIARVSEYANVDTVVAHIQVEDHDLGSQGITSCLLQSDDFKLKRHQSNGFMMVVARQLDHERTPFQNVTVHCQDNGSPPLRTSETFKVEITDENDNPPVFSRPSYSVSVPENVSIGSSILKVKVSDLDKGRNAQMYFRISQNVASYFYVENGTGILRVNRTLDRETNQNFIFAITAIDNGSMPLTGTVTVKVTLTDINDERPTFTQPQFNLGVMENLPSDSVVGRVTALDLDDGPNAKIRFKLDPSYIGKVPFVVFEDGLIKTDRELNRESTSRYEFKVVAIDSGDPPLSHSVNVTVSVADTNDNFPDFIFPKDGNNTLQISKSLTAWQVATRILAEDIDEDNTGNSNLRYEIAGRNDSNLFQINPTSGVIKVTRDTQNIPINTIYKLDIVVSDFGDPVEKSSISALWVYVYSHNATAGLEQTEELSNRNLIIAVVVGIVTVVISIAIIVVICVIRKIDFQRRQERKARKENDVAEHKVFDGSITVFSLPSEDSLIGEKKKKEVSFSLEEDVFSDDDLIQKNGLDQHRNFKPPLSYLSPKKVEDNHSETSGDTGTSDSGRGGSDEEIHNSFIQSPRDKGPDLTRSIPTMPHQEIIPFSFKKGLVGMHGFHGELDRSRNKVMLLQTDSGIHSDTNSNEDEHRADISRDFMV